MNEITQISSRFGQVSITIAVLDFIGMAILIIATVLVSSFISGDFKYSVGTITLIAFFLFPLIAGIGLIIGGIGFFQSNFAKFYSVLGVILNVANLLLWACFVIYQITFNANRFKL